MQNAEWASTIRDTSVVPDRRQPSSDLGAVEAVEAAIPSGDGSESVRVTMRLFQLLISQCQYDVGGARARSGSAVPTRPVTVFTGCCAAATGMSPGYRADADRADLRSEE